MKVLSAKAKGRDGQQEVVRLIKSHLNLDDDDIKSTPASVTGEDIWLSKYAHQIFPFSIEVKRVEKLNVDSAYAQAESNSGGFIPLLVHRKNNQKWKVTMDFIEYLEIISSMRSLEERIREYEKSELPY